MLDQAATLAEYIDTTLMPVVDLVPPDRRITVRRYPHAGEIIRVDFVVDELTQSVLVHVDAASLAVMDLAVDDGGIGACLHLETGYPIIVNIVRFEITLKLFE